MFDTHSGSEEFLLQGLNESQRKAVLHTDGPLMILAGAGSGKTKTLVSKISYLIEHKKVSPSRLLALTFSNKAAREMRERVEHTLGIYAQALNITTFHSFCARVLRKEFLYLGLGRNFSIYDDSESKTIVKTILERSNISPKEISPQSILYYIERLKNMGFYSGRDHSKLLLDEQHSGRMEELKRLLEDPYYRFYQEYEGEIHRSNAVDFGGLITGVLKLFETVPRVLENYQRQFFYLLVDEYQDTNRAQFDLISLLATASKNICVVGDEDQSIYSWRGADIRNILDFEKIFKDSALIKLEQNYRSSKTIIEAASAVIANNDKRKGKVMWTDNPQGDLIEVVECGQDRFEGDFLVNKVEELRKENVKYKDMAVFYRANSQSRLLEDSLRRSNIPYVIIGGVKFYERKEIKDMMSYLRLVVNFKDSLALGRIINLPARGIGVTTMRKFEHYSIEQNISLWETLENITKDETLKKEFKLSAKIQSAIESFVFLILEASQKQKDGQFPSVIYEYLLNQSGYLDSLKLSKNYESLSRIENLEELYTAIKQFEESTEDPNLTKYLESISLDSTQQDSQDLNDGEDFLKEELRKSLGSVSLMTIHGAKGLEFSYTFIVGVEETIFPSYKSLELGELALEEERRLFYVAMTRAMKKLFITFSQSRMLFGNLQFNGPGRFIFEIPKQFVKWTKYFSQSTDHTFSRSDVMGPSFKSKIKKPLASKVSKLTSTNGFNSNKLSPSSISNSEFSSGSKVEHKLYGQGVITESSGQGLEQMVSIRFRDGVLKKFKLSLAPITKIK